MKLHKYIFFILGFLNVSFSYSQNYQINFAGSGASSIIDSVKVDNLTQNATVIIHSNDVLQIGNTGISINNDNDEKLILFPNPMSGESELLFFAKNTSLVNLKIYDISGKLIIKQSNNLQQGIHKYQIKGIKQGIYFIQIQGENYFYTMKLISLNPSDNNVNLSYIGIDNQGFLKKSLKETTSFVNLPFSNGDMLLFKGYSGNYSNIVIASPAINQTITFVFTPCIDKDSNNYTTVQIGNQLWMAENLKTTKYNNGDSIPNVISNSTWSNLTYGACCNYNNDSANTSIFGKIYNFITVKDIRKICPSNWHIPYDTEWTVLSDYLGGENIAGGKIKETGSNHWIIPNSGASNISGFTALAAGGRNYLGDFDVIFRNGGWWSATEDDSTHAWSRYVYYMDSSITRYNNTKTSGWSLRCLYGDFPEVYTINATNITNNSVSCGGNIISDGGLPITSKGVCWSTNPYPTINESHTTDGVGNGNFTTNITGLNYATTYYARAYVINSMGISYGNEIIFTTLANLPSLSTAIITSITSNSAASGGNITNNGGGNVTNRGVCWNTSQYPTISDSHTTDGTGIGNFISLINGLYSNTTYYIRAYATNSAGTSYGNQLSFTTSIIVYLPSIITNDVMSITSNSATTGGYISNSGGATISERGVCYDTMSNPTILKNHTSDGTNIGNFSSFISNLLPGKTYYVRAYACNPAGTAYGNQKVFTTLATIPTLTTHTITSITADSAVSGGDITDNGGAMVTKRGVCFDTVSNPQLYSAKYTDDGLGNGIFISKLKNLISGKTYYVRAYAINSIDTAYGNQYYFTTLNKAPVLTTLTVDSITLNTAISGGHIINNGGLTITTRGICFDTIPNPTISGNFISATNQSDSFIAKLTGLLSSKTYYIRAYASNSMGLSYGNELSFKTIVKPWVSTDSVYAITSNNALCGSFVFFNGGDSLLARGVCWSTSSAPTILNNKTIDGNGMHTLTSSVNSLTSGTNYYLRAYATNSIGTAYGNEISFTTPIQLTIGMSYAGGLVFHIDSTGQHGMVCAPFDQSNGAPFGCNGSFGTSQNFGAGLSNTALLVTGCPTLGTAAQICNDLILNGYNDWFLPSASEVNYFYSNVLVNDIYNQFNFQGGYLYWTSSEISVMNWAYAWGPGGGSVPATNRSFLYKVRAFRKF